MRQQSSEEEEPNWLRDAESEMRKSLDSSLDEPSSVAAARVAVAEVAAFGGSVGSSPLSHLCLSDGGTRRALSACEHARACASEALGSTEVLSMELRGAERARRAAEERCTDLEAALAEERSRADGLVALQSSLVSSHHASIGEMSTAMNLMRSELSGLEVEYEDQEAAVGGRVQGLKLGHEAANREAARCRKEASDLRREISELRGTLETERRRCAALRQTSASSEGGVLEPSPARAIVTGSSAVMAAAADVASALAGARPSLHG